MVKIISFDVLTNQWILLNLAKIEPEAVAKDDSAFYNYASNSWMAAPYNVFSSFDGDFFSVSQLLWKKVLKGGKDSLLASKEFTIPTTETNTDWYVVIKAGCWNTPGDNMLTFSFVFVNISLNDNVITSVAMDDAMDIFNVYPNPSSGILNFESSSKGLVKYELYNTLGSMVKSCKVAINLILHH